MIAEKKKCNKCEIEKEINYFGNKRSTCKQCRAEYNKQRRIKNLEKIKQTQKLYRSLNKDKLSELHKTWRLNNKDNCKNRQKKYRSKNIKKVLLRNSLQRAKRKNLEHDITIDDIDIPEYCPILGIKIDVSAEKGIICRDSSPSIDRVDNNKGYTKDNIKIISFKANNLKGDATVEELQKVLEYMKQFIILENKC